METAVKQATHIRWMVRRDMAEVLAIEEDVFDDPWSEDIFIRELRQRNVIGFVAEREARIAGVLVYDLSPKRIDIINIGIRRDLWRSGVGRAFISKLFDKLSLNGRSQITANVRETNLLAQIFFRSMGFKCNGVLADHFELSTGGFEDAYHFTYRLES